MTIVSFQYAGATDKGERERQEDSYGIRVFQKIEKTAEGSPRDAAIRWGNDQERAGALVAVLADGMGGHAGGAKASKLICSKFLSEYPNIDGGVKRRLVLALDACNKEISQNVRRDEKLRGMGSTLIGVSLTGDGVSWISVGDSLLYLYRNKKLKRLNEDHSLAPVLDELAAKGEIGVEESRNHPKRNLLRSAVAGEDIELVDVTGQAQPLRDGDWLIIASDGLLSLSRKETEAIIAKSKGRGAEHIAQGLLRAVKKKAVPSQDNTTILAIGMSKIQTPA